MIYLTVGSPATVETDVHAHARYIDRRMLLQSNVRILTEPLLSDEPLDGQALAA